MSLQALLSQLHNNPQDVEFDNVMAVIAESYDYTPTRFSNGAGNECVINEAGSNEGSCKIFAFAQLNNLTPAQTLACFGRFYRDDVLKHFEGSDHANIRTFMRHGWDGISFDQPALTAK